MAFNPYNNPRYSPAIRQFELACFYSRAHSELAESACDTWGGHGPLISGCVRDHFPAQVKETLRQLAQAVTRHSESAYAERPKGARHETIRRIGQLIATRDGSGRYGPQPARAA